MIRKLTIKNYKSIRSHAIDLGRINVFIGENGCGKTNILEALAMAAAALTDKLTVEELFNRGMRVAKPTAMRSAFPGPVAKDIELSFTFESNDTNRSASVDLRLSSVARATTEVAWVETGPRSVTINLGKGAKAKERAEVITTALSALESTRRLTSVSAELRDRLIESIGKALESILTADEATDLSLRIRAQADRAQLAELLGSFGVYDASTMALRGLTTTSRRAPMGIYGETLDVAIAGLGAEASANLLTRARCISWLDKFVVDPSDALRYEGHKLGKSQSALYFHDKHMRKANNVFSAENVNEGVLHVLFHLTMFMSDETPRILGIDNIGSALNPQLCRNLMKQLPDLAKKHGKQALVTTHNPAILDGLDLNDDEQRLFVVSRSDEGHTRTRRITAKPDFAGDKFKLSELWMRGLIGGLPEGF